MTVTPRRAWRALRSRYWLSLAFDCTLILLVFWGIHTWQTRDLPSGGPAPALPRVALDGPVPAMDEGQGIVYFFAPWCGVCRASIDNIDAMREAGRVDWAVAVALDYADLAAVRRFVDDTGLRAPVLLGDAGTARDWRIRGYPTYVVVDEDGLAGRPSVGYSTWLGLWWRTRGG
jgi:thiol-disulfide isomerase/thioredoxin